MGKKKQFAGKKTKLAKLPLTKALAGQAGGAAPWGQPSSSPPPASRQVPLTWEQADQGGVGPWAAAYLHLVQELSALRLQLQGATGALPGGPPTLLPHHLPESHLLQRALLQAKKDLQNLHRFLSEG